MAEGKSVISTLVTSTLALLTVLGTYKMVSFFIKWGAREGGLASQQQAVIPAPGCVLLSPTENNEAVIVDSGTLSFIKPGDTVLLSGPVFSMDSHDCEDGIFAVHGKNILALRR